MTAAYFSPSLNSFIPVEWKEDGTYNDETWPADAVLATDEEVAAYWKQTPPEGKQPGSANGRPAWVDIPPLSAEQVITLAKEKKETLLRAATSKIVVWQTKLLMGRKLTAEETEHLNAWMDYIDAVTAVDTSTAPGIEWPEMPES